MNLLSQFFEREPAYCVSYEYPYDSIFIIKMKNPFLFAQVRFRCGDNKPLKFDLWNISLPSNEILPKEIQKMADFYDTISKDIFENIEYAINENYQPTEKFLMFVNQPHDWMGVFHTQKPRALFKLNKSGDLIPIIEIDNVREHFKNYPPEASEKFMVEMKAHLERQNEYSKLGLQP